MISQTNTSVIRNVYPNKLNESKEPKPNATLTTSGDVSKIEKLKESIDSGEYKVNLQVLSERMADSLL